MSRFLLAVLLLATVGTAIAVVYERYRHRQLFVDLTRLERERDELNIEFGRLQLEQATWAQANRIDQVARERLGMKFPEAEDIVAVELGTGPRALLLGTEGPGLPATLLARAHHRVRIPMAGGVDSLNVGAASAIALHVLRQAVRL